MFYVFAALAGAELCELIPNSANDNAADLCSIYNSADILISELNCFDLAFYGPSECQFFVGFSNFE